MSCFIYFLKDENGMAAIEYGMLVALISSVMIPMLTLVGQQLAAIFNSVTFALAR